MKADAPFPATSSPPRPRTRIWPALLVFAAILIFACAGLVLWFLSFAHSALPQIDGAIAVAGLSAPVSVTRDAHGVPTINALTLNDLFFAQGYVTAQDRLFQMDLLRRAANGDLAEIVGPVALKHDRQQRILGIRAAAEKGLQAATPEDRQQFGQYARGVNAYIESHRNRLPIEFRILHYSPKPWTMGDSLAIAYQMVETLSTSPKAALTREKILAKLGPELTADLYVNTSWRDHPPTTTAIPSDGSSPEQVPATPASVTQSAPIPELLRPWLESFLRDDPAPMGSNNWVVSGAHTTTGKPLLSNDMHLGHQMPNLWYEAHLRSADFDVAGVTLPGYPYVIVGHNSRIAWGFTNVGPTVEDAYIETFNAQGQYLTPDGWKSPEVRRKVIHVKNQPDVDLDVQITRHGPIVTELSPGETRKIALRWTLYDGIRNPFFHLDSAQNWQQFRQALSEFDAPGQNAVYADVDGNIGYQTTGKVPIRASGDGSLPVDGSNNAHEWTGYIPFDKLPSVLNPPSGIIATANSRIAPDGYPYSISAEWEAPWRSDRIYRVLGSGRKLSASDMLALEMDIYSELDHFIADKLVYAVDHSSKASSQAHKAADILRDWNAQMAASSAAPTIVTHAQTELLRLLLEPKLGTAPAKDSDADSDSDSKLSWKSYHWMNETTWLENVLSHEPARWLPPGYANFDDLLAAALDNAVKDAPGELNSWKWGPANSTTIQNPVLGRIPILREWTGPGRQPQSGSVYTVKAAGRTYGPSERFTVDLSRLDSSTLNVVTGNSGNFLSPYYMDQWNAWYTGYTFVLPFSTSAVEKSAAHRLMLQPQ
ncbi:MAG TPA: penicillin acylase family protein [Terriglobales bacterium]|nr:penicillin acylase family protein [Terriglobales bacterium]